GPHAADATLHVRDRVRIPCEKVRADRAEAGGRSNRRQREVEIVDLRAYVAEVSDARAAKTAVVKVVRKASEVLSPVQVRIEKKRARAVGPTGKLVEVRELIRAGVCAGCRLPCEQYGKCGARIRSAPQQQVGA